jgi:hypothetical protein
LREIFNPPNEDELKIMHAYSEARILPFVEKFDSVFSVMDLDLNQAITASFYALIWWIDIDNMAKELRGDLMSLMTRFIASYRDPKLMDAEAVEEFSLNMQTVSVCLSSLGKPDKLSSHEIIYSLILSIIAMSKDAVGISKEILDQNMEWLAVLGNSLLRQLMANALDSEKWPFGKSQTIPFRV